jgi:hypothetical protein
MKSDLGVIRADEAYSKNMLLQTLGISQKFWDKMLAQGLPYTPVGHTRWVTGRDLLQHLQKHSQVKQAEAE